MKLSMHQGKYVFAQIVEFLPRYGFEKFVSLYQGDKRIRNLTCRDQFLAMMFGQLANVKSLRGIALCLNAHSNLLYHLGFRSDKISKSTLSYANENRDFRIYLDLAMLLIKKARKLYVDDNDLGIEIKGAVYAIDSTTIELCLSIFKWAYHQREESAVKIHTQLDLKANIPSFFLITVAKISDLDFLDRIEIEKNAFYVMDRGYTDFARLHRINQAEAFFIIRAKSTLSFKRLYSGEINKSIGLRCDQTIKLKFRRTKKSYPEKLRRIKYYDRETDKHYVFLTNNFNLDAKTIADLYKNRWKIELFFKWIKQHLRIEVFWGHSANAVKTQICIAMCAFLTVAIMKKQLKIERNIYEILQIVNVSQFEKTPINTILSEVRPQIFNEQSLKQLSLLDI